MLMAQFLAEIPLHLLIEQHQAKYYAALKELHNKHKNDFLIAKLYAKSLLTIQTSIGLHRCFSGLIEDLESKKDQAEAVEVAKILK